MAARALELPTRYGQKVTIAGTLTNSATGTVLADGMVTVYATNVATDVMKVAGTTTTSANGQYSYKLAAGPDPRIDIVYGGTTGQTHRRSRRASPSCHRGAAG